MSVMRHKPITRKDFERLTDMMEAALSARDEYETEDAHYDPRFRDAREARRLNNMWRHANRLASKASEFARKRLLQSA